MNASTAPNLVALLAVLLLLTCELLLLAQQRGMERGVRIGDCPQSVASPKLPDGTRRLGFPIAAVPARSRSGLPC